MAWYPPLCIRRASWPMQGLADQHAVAPVLCGDGMLGKRARPASTGSALQGELTSSLAPLAKLSRPKVNGER